MNSEEYWKIGIIADLAKYEGAELTEYALRKFMDEHKPKKPRRDKCRGGGKQYEHNN